MFCGECGSKNDKDSMFCSECGSKLTAVEKPTKKVSKKKEDHAKAGSESKTKKIKKPLIIFIVILAIVAGIGYKVCSDLTNPKRIANEYLKAIVNNDKDKLYDYFSIEGDKTFASKKIYKSLVKETNTNKIENFKVTDVEKKDLTAIVRYSYTIEGSSYESTDYVSLVKAKNKKFLFFDDWKIGNIQYSNSLIKDFTVKVLKDSEVEYAGVKITDKYKKKDNDSTTYDVYVLPQVFKYETVIKAKLPSGIEVEDSVIPSLYTSSVTIKFNEKNISEKMKKEIIKVSKEGLTNIYSCAIDMLEFDRTISNFKHEGLDLTKLENSYNEFKSSLLSSTNVLKSITFKDMSIYDLNLDDDGYFNVELKINYDYTIGYKLYEEEKDVSKTGTSYMKVVLKYEDSDFYMYDISNLKTYFSRY